METERKETFRENELETEGRGIEWKRKEIEKKIIKRSLENIEKEKGEERERE